MIDSQKNKWVKLVLISNFCLFLYSCSQDVEYEPPVIERKLLMHSILNPDSTLRINVSRTQGLREDSIEYISNATVKVFVNESDSPFETAYYEQNGYYTTQSTLSEGTKYTVQTEVPGYKTVQASDYIPSKVNILSARYQHPFEYDAINDLTYGLLTLTFRDNAGERNCYEIIPLRRSEIDGKVYLYRVRPFIVSHEYFHVDSENQDNPESILFDDNKFNGKEITLKIKVQISDPPYIYFRNTTETYYRYQRSLYTYLFTRPEKNDRFFTVEPVSLYSNIENGFGIIAGYNQSEIQSIKQ